MQQNLHLLRYLTIALSLLCIEINAQKLFLNVDIQAENYYIKTFDLQNATDHASLNLIPNLRYGLTIGYTFLERNSIYLGANVGSVSSRFVIHNEKSVPVGRIVVKDHSYQIHLSYSYAILQSRKFTLKPTVTLTYNQNSFRKRIPEVVKVYPNFDELDPVARLLSSKDLNFYFTSGFGLRFTFMITDRIHIGFISSGHLSLVPNYLLGILGTVQNQSALEEVRQELLLNSGSRLSNALTLSYILKSYR